MRRIERVRADGIDLVGTLHEPVQTVGDVGFLFLNAGHVPREGHAGVMARVADRLADLGFPAWRFDLPGLGDSPGGVPVRLEDFFQRVHDGMFVEPATTLVRRLASPGGVRRIVLGGLCGGAATGIFVADREPGAVAGLVALEAEFSRPGEEDPRSLWGKLASRGSWLRLLTGHSRMSSPFLVRAGRHVLGPWLLPPLTNRKLVSCYQAVVARGIPVLVMMAAGKRRDLFIDQVDRVLFQIGRAHV